jgi:hypothetical protein
LFCLFVPFSPNRSYEILFGLIFAVCLLELDLQCDVSCFYGACTRNDAVGNIPASNGRHVGHSEGSMGVSDEKLKRKREVGFFDQISHTLLLLLAYTHVTVFGFRCSCSTSSLFLLDTS